jgi:hypothetical protein
MRDCVQLGAVCACWERVCGMQLLASLLSECDLVLLATRYMLTLEFPEDAF